MCTKSKQKKSFTLAPGKRIVVTLVAIISMLVAHAQVSPVSVNVMVAPPYTSSISDYMTIPNKILITLTHTSFDYPDVDLYLKVSIIGDNGVSAISDEDYKPSVPITLQKGTSRIINIDNISDAFNLSHIVIEGTTLNELVNGAGLPEGFYRICVRAFDYATDEPLSGEDPIGCSNLFSVTNFEPPMFNTPVCGEPQLNFGPQLVSVSWTIPSAMATGLSYHFEMVEIPENVTIDPNEAFLTAGFPVLYEETLNQTMLILTVDKVSLNPGYTYAMRVTAEDPSGSAHFRNGGTSEVCWFKYEQQGLTVGNGEKYIRFVIPAYNNPDSVLTANPVDGFYTGWRVEPFDTVNYHDPLEDYPGCKFQVEFFDEKEAQTPILKTNTTKPFFHANPIADALPFENGESYWERVSIIDPVSNEQFLVSELWAFNYRFNESAAGMEARTITGKIEYKFEKDDQASYPVNNSSVKLMSKFVLNDTVQGVKINIPFENIPSEIADLPTVNYLSGILASGTTSTGGTFALTYNWPEKIKVGEIKPDFSFAVEGNEYKGTLSLILYTELDNPYYSGIDQEISYDINPCNLGTVYTYVYSYKINAVIYEGYKDAPGIKKNLENKEVYVLRKGKKPEIPIYEGEKFDAATRGFTPTEIKNAGYIVVASEMTKAGIDSDGKNVAIATFTRLIQNLVNGDDYYLWIKGSNILTVEPFRYYISMAEEQQGENSITQLSINGINYSILGGNTGQQSSGQAQVFSSNNIASLNGTNNYTLQGHNAGSSQSSGGLGNLQYTGNSNNFSQFTQTGGETFNIPEFDFGTDQIGEEIGTFSNISNYSFTVESGFTLISNLPPMSGISGRIVYEFPAKAGNARPLNNKKISLISCLVSDEVGEASKMIKADYIETYPQAFPGTYTLYTTQTDANGYFNFQFPNILPNSHTVDPTQGLFDISTGKLNRNSAWISWESDPGTEFHITYAKKQVKVKRVLRIVIEDEAGIFLSPCENFSIEPLKSADVGTISAEVFSYKLKGETIRNWEEKYPCISPYGVETFCITFHHDTIKGAECFVLREKSQIEMLDLPVDEGQNIVGSLPDYPNLKIVSYTTSGTDGGFEFDNLIFRNSTAPVYLYFRTKDMMGIANYEPKWEQPKVNKFAKPLYFFRNDYDYSSITGFATSMEPRNPTLKGRVISDVNTQKGLNKAQVKIIMTFNSRAPYNYTIQTDTTGKFDFTPIFNSICSKNWINDLTYVTIEVSKNGFHYLENGDKKSKYTNGFTPEKFEMGKQVVLDNIHLYADGSIKGRIINENGAPVEAYVQFLENSSSASAVETGEMHKTSGFYTMGNIALGQTGEYISNGKFQIPAIPGSNRKLVIIPKDVTYFSDTLTINVSGSAVTDLGDIKVYERQHRIYFYVKRTMGGDMYQISQPLPGAKVSVIGAANTQTFTSDANGKVVMNFKNVSESNLTLKVSGPPGSNYVPKNIAFTNEESETPVQLPTVYLEQGLTVKGKVLLDGNATADAEVYVELSRGIQTDVDINFASDGGQAVSESQYLFTAKPKSDGTFEINTIPPELKNKQVTLKVVYKKSLSSFGRGQTGSTGTQNQLGNNQTITQSHGSTDEKTIFGESKQVMIPETSGNLVLNLTSFNDMIIKDIWGFPLEITKLEKIPNTNKVKIDGRVKPEGYSPGFDPIEPLNLEVKFVEFQPSGQMLNGKPIGVPVEPKVIVSSQRMLKLKYAKAFNVKLSTHDNSLFTISRENATSNNGKLNVTVQIIDNSFQFPSSYLNFEGVDFYFCKTTSSRNMTYSSQNVTYFTPVIDVFNSATPGNGNSVVKYNLCNLSGYNSPAKDLTFKFINFTTTASKANSFVVGDEITLDAKLHATVKNAGEVEVEIGKLVLKNNAILPVSGSTPVIITLKDGGIHNADKEWKFEARDWTIDPKVGGLESKNCTLHTGTIDIPYSYFNLRSDFAYLGNPDCSKLNMAGYPVKLRPGAMTTTGYNASCGSDGVGHWQLIIHPASSGIYAGMSPAYVENLPNMHANLELETVSLLSNGEDVFTIGTGAATMKLYNIVDFKPQMVFTLNDGLILSGTLGFHIPRVSQNVGTSLTFRKSQPIASNPIPDPIDIGFEAKGNVLFKINPSGQKFNTASNTFTTYGTVEEPGKLDPIQVLLTYHSNTDISKITTDIIESPNATGQKVKIGEDKTYLEKVECNMNADQTDWSLLTFEGDMAGFNGVKADANKHMVFTVHGEIEAEQNEFGADGIDAEFGGMKISYHNGRLLGSLTMENIPLGSVIVSGMANILMDSEGWAFYSNASADGVPCPDNTTVYMGILIGNYPSGITTDMSNVVLKYAVKKEMPPTFNEGLKGFFMVGGRNLPISGLDIGIDVVVASAYVRVPVAAVDASFYMNFANGQKVIGTGLNGKLVIEFGLESITCTDLSGGAFAEVYAGGIYDNGSLNFSGGASFGAELNISQGIPYLAGCIDAIDIDVPTINGGFRFSLNPFDVKMCLGKDCEKQP